MKSVIICLKLERISEETSRTLKKAKLDRSQESQKSTFTKTMPIPQQKINKVAAAVATQL